MARTSNGNLAGRAAATDRADLTEQILSGDEKRRARGRDLMLAQENLAIQKCVSLEGEEKFRAWYDDDNNIPPKGKTGERIQLVLNHYHEILDARVRADANRYVSVWEPQLREFLAAVVLARLYPEVVLNERGDYFGSREWFAAIPEVSYECHIKPT